MRSVASWGSWTVICRGLCRFISAMALGERGILEEEASVAPAGDLCDVDGVDQVPSSLGPGLGWG